MHNILFIVENNPIYRDQRVLSEINTIQKFFDSNIFVISPKFSNASGQKKVLKNVKLFQYPCIEATNKIAQIFEYFISAIFIFFISNYLIIKHKIQIVHIANPPDFLILLLPFAKLYNTKFIYDQHDLSLEIYINKNVKPRPYIDKFLKYSLNMFENLSYNLCHAILFPNSNVQEYYYDKIKNSDKINAVVRNGISEDYRKYLINMKDISRVRISSDKFSIVYIGIITKESGVDNLITLAQYLIDQKVNFIFEIYGEGSYHDQFKTKVISLNLEPYFRFHGFNSISDIIRSAQYCHIGIVPLANNSKNNIGTARKIYEYMVMALPVVSLKLQEVMNVVEDGGLFCNDFQEMGCLISEIAHQKEYLIKIGLIGQDRFINYFSWECQEKNLVNIYNYLLKTETYERVLNSNLNEST